MNAAPPGPDWGAEPTPPAPDAAAGDAPVAKYCDFESWVAEWLTPTIRRPLRGGAVWCPEWWRHDEACVRLDALWRAWEIARVQGGSGLSEWWVVHFDAHWTVLTGAQGPFGACKDHVHSDKLGPLPFTMPPDDWTFLHPIDGGDQR